MIVAVAADRLGLRLGGRVVVGNLLSTETQGPETPYKLSKPRQLTAPGGSSQGITVKSLSPAVGRIVRPKRLPFRQCAVAGSQAMFMFIDGSR